MYKSPAGSLDKLERKVLSFTPDRKHPHDPFVLISLEEAIAAAREGNFGVGAVLVNGDGEVVQRGHNHVFNPHFRSDLHAEMDVMTKFEERCRDISSLRDYVLYTSLEPCPMCLTRLITSGVGKVYHAAPDIESGMVYKLKDLTPVWVELAQRQEYAEADCSSVLKDIAMQIFLVTANKNTKKLRER